MARKFSPEDYEALTARVRRILHARAVKRRQRQLGQRRGGRLVNNLPPCCDWCRMRWARQRTMDATRVIGVDR